MKRDAIEDEICAKRFKKNKLDEQIRKLKLEINELVEVNRLPMLVMHEILRNLDVEDWFSFECVCRRWRQVVREFANKPGLVIRKVIEGKSRKWHSREPCSPGSIIVRSNLHFDPEHSFLSTLRQLKITNRSEDRDSIRADKLPLLTDLVFLNSLKSLQVLEIEKFDLDEDKHNENNHLSLANLQHLTISVLCSPIQLDTPSLSSFRSKFINDYSPKFLYPEKIRRLHVRKLAYEYSWKAFTNLEYLTFKKFSYFEKDDDHLFDPPALKQLSIRPAYKKQLKFDLLRSRTLRLLEKKRKLGKDDLRIIFFGFQLDEPDQLADFKYSPCVLCNSGNYEELLQKNHSKLIDSELRFIKQINYPGYEDSADSFQSDFYRKLSYVEQVCVYESNESGEMEYTSEEVDSLMSFLKIFKNLNSLIYKAPPDPSFFEQLLAVFPLLRSLAIEYFADPWTVDCPQRGEYAELLEKNSGEIKELIAKFQHLHKFSSDFAYETSQSSVYDVGERETFEYYSAENGYPYKVKKLQFFHRSCKIARYELYVHDDRNSSPKFDELFGDYPTLGQLMSALHKDYAD